jgi:signal transduction histidine kinase
VLVSNILGSLLRNFLLKRREPIRLTFNICQWNIAALTAYLILLTAPGDGLLGFTVISLVVVLAAFLVYALISTGLVSMVIALHSGTRFLSIWRKNHLHDSIGIVCSAPIILTMIVLFDQYGALPVLLVAIPVTAFNLLSQLLVDRAQKQAREQRDQQLTRMGKASASILHEITKPLSRIVMTSDFARTGNMPQEEAFSQIMADAHDAHDLSEKLLGAMRFEINRTDCSAAEIVERLADLAAREDLPAEIVCEPEVSHVRGMWDRDLVVTALQNLLRNAWQSQQMEGPAPRVHVSLAEAEGLDAGKNASVLRFVIADSGSGIPIEHESDLFEALVSTKEAGSGIGLFLANQVAMAHGGQIKARNTETGGAEFILEIPPGSG